MLFAIGTKVKFLHSKDEGVVTALLEGGMVSVLLTGEDMEIPAFIEDLVRIEDDGGPLPSARAAAGSGKLKRPEISSGKPEPETKHSPLEGTGIQLAFDPVQQTDTLVDHYDIFLLNGTTNDVLYSCSLNFHQTTGRRFHGKLDALSFVKTGEMLFDQLNDTPVFDIECWRIMTGGTGSRLHRQLRIRPKQFFSRLATAPLVNRQVHLFTLFEDLSAQPTGKTREEDLRTYTRRNAAPAKKWSDRRQRFPHDILEFAAFVPEIDLHIERLSPEPQKLSNAEITRLQMAHFEAFMAKAIRLGVDRVFIIHGIGKGRLRDAIATRLITMPEVISFKNEYHSRYGWGATEVVLEES